MGAVSPNRHAKRKPAAAQNHTRERQALLALLSAGVWGTKAVTPAAGIDWGVVYRMAREQSVIGIVFDAVGTLPEAQKPGKELLLDWFGNVCIIERANRRMNASLVSLVAYLDGQGVAIRLMKGQGCASLYPKPLHRQCGDIDLFVGDGQYGKAKSLFVRKGIGMEKENVRDVHFLWEKTPVEMHRTEIFFYNQTLNKRLEAVFREEEWREPQTIYIGFRRIELFSPTLNVFYIFVHLYHHFLQTGIGLRQVCDWMLAMKASEETVDWDRLHKYIISTDTLRAWKAFYGLTVEHLGQHLHNVPVWMSAYSIRDVRFLLNDIMRSGNFGKHGDSLRKRSFNGGLLRNAGSFLSLARRLVSVSRFGRREAVAYPLWKIFKDKTMLDRYRTKQCYV